MKKIPWWQPEFGKKEISLVKGVLESAFPNEGKLTTSFENEIENLLDVKHVLAVTSATAAMFLSLKALGIGHGDEVIVPDLTFLATANAVEMTGAKAILADIDPKTLTLNNECFEKAITKKTKAVIPVHVSGRAADMEAITAIAGKNKLHVIEDAAEAFMSKHKGKFLGTLGKTGCFSLSPAKTISTGQGGFIVTNDDTLSVKLKMLKDQGRPVRGTGGDDTHPGLGFNFKFTDLQAAVGLGQLTYLKKRIARMRKNHLLYQKHLSDVNQIVLLPFNIQEGELPQWTDAVVERRDELAAYLLEHGIDSRKFWFPIHTQAYYKQTDRNFPVSSKLSKKALWLPSAFTLTDEEVTRVCETIKRFYI